MADHRKEKNDAIRPVHLPEEMPDEEVEDYEPEDRHGKKKKKRKWLVVLAVVVGITLVLGIAVLVLFNRYYDLSNFRRDGDESVSDSTIEEVDKYVDDTKLTPEEIEALRRAAEEANKSTETIEDEDIYNILLIGVDRRDTSWAGNSDSMILISINKKTEKIHMISFMRDLYADIPGVGVRKLNAACAYGGGSLLVRTIEENYKVKIDNYASVDFGGMIDIIDEIGGVTLTLSDAEANSANGSIREMCRLRGVSADEHLLSGGGTYNCDGYQAVAYARIRHVGNSDWQRTERQRTVLTKILEKVRKMNVSQLDSFAVAVLPLVTHNLEKSEVINLIVQATTFLKYDLETDRVPYDGLYTINKEILVPDMAATIARLQETIYGTEEESTETDTESAG